MNEEKKLKRHISGKIFTAIENLNFFKNGSDYVIRENVKLMFDTVLGCNCIMRKKDVNKMCEVLNRRMNFDFSFNSKLDNKCDKLAAQFLLYLFFTWKELDPKGCDDRVFEFKLFEEEEELFDRFKYMKTMDKWEPFFEEDEEMAEGKRILHQMLRERYEGFADIYDENGNKIMPTSIKLKKNTGKKKRDEGTDKRFKNFTIQVLDGDTRELIEEFDLREDVIKKYGIAKSRLSQCITSCKDSNWQSWARWKDKNTGNRYYFKEVHFEK